MNFDFYGGVKLKETYIHYGHKHLNKDLFEPIKNRTLFVKPFGGLWASNINARFGWKDWCEVEEFGECDKENSFSFTISDDARILQINSVKDIKNLPTHKDDFSCSWTLLDFEKLSKMYDIIEANISNSDELYFCIIWVGL